PITKPFFNWNHEMMMRHAAEDLGAELARRAGSPPRPRAQPRTSPFVPPNGGKSVTVLGNRITFKAVSEDTGGAYSLFEVQNGPQTGPPAHLFYRLDGAAYVLEGSYLFQIGDQTVTATPGAFVL